MPAKKTWQMAIQLIVVASLFLACLSVVLPFASTAQDSLPWRGEYFDNQNLTGDPVLIRQESAINYEWKDKAPDAKVPVDHFSARWSALLLFEEGTYLFKTYTDDGVRLWVDGQLVIDQWHDQAATLYQQPVSLSAGYHSLRMEYYDNIGDAVAMLWWEPYTGPEPTPVPSETMWRAEYFDNQNLFGTPVAFMSFSKESCTYFALFIENIICRPVTIIHGTPIG